MRLFVAVLLPGDIQDFLHHQIEKAHLLPGLRWVTRENRHITLKFLGDVAENKTNDVKSALTSVVTETSPIQLALELGGVFPQAENPRVFWTGVGGDVAGLTKLAGGIEVRFQECGFSPEGRSFQPHITVARAKKDFFGINSKAKAMTVADQFCTLFSNFRTPMFTAIEIHLMKSALTPDGARYESLDLFPLRFG